MWLHLGNISDEYIVPTRNTNGDATKGIVDNGSLLAEYDFSKSLFLNVKNIVVSFDNSLKKKMNISVILMQRFLIVHENCENQCKINDVNCTKTIYHNYSSIVWFSYTSNQNSILIEFLRRKYLVLCFLALKELTFANATKLHWVGIWAFRVWEAVRLMGDINIAYELYTMQF